MSNLFPKSVRKAVFQRCAAMLDEENSVLLNDALSDHLKELRSINMRHLSKSVLTEMDRHSLL